MNSECREYPLAGAADGKWYGKTSFAGSFEICPPDCATVTGPRCIAATSCMQPLEGCDPCDVEDPWGSVEKHHDQVLPWWFKAGCFCYSIVGMFMLARLRSLECGCSTYRWHGEAVLLLLQGFLSYLHDAHFQGRSYPAKVSDKSCATFLTLCQPLKLAACHMDRIQVAILLLGWISGIVCFRLGLRAYAAGNADRFHVFHTLWHIFLPLAGLLWIEYTTSLVSFSTVTDAAADDEVSSSLAGCVGLLQPT